MNKTIQWSEGPEATVDQAASMLRKGGKTVVAPTKVGYIITTVDTAGLESKFALKNRTKTKPAVVLCTSLEQLRELAQTNPAIDELYAKCYDQDILLGCILPWKPEAAAQYIPVGAETMVHDARDTSCFVIRFGEPSEQIVRALWNAHRQLVFASSANPSGQGNRGQLAGVGERILSGADMLIEADDYVAAQQPGKSIETRHEQGVMISMVGADGQLLDPPAVIRRGLSLDRLMFELSQIYNQFDYRHGQYY